jgi:hypothetical protein
MLIDPYSFEIRYSLDFMIYQLFKNCSPQKIRIVSNSLEIVESIIRRLSCRKYSFIVQNRDLQVAITKKFRIQPQVFNYDDIPADVALFPFSQGDIIRTNGEASIIAVCWNSLSYKSLLYPKLIQGNIYNKMNRFRHSYQLKSIAGLYSPNFIIRLGLAKVAEYFNSSWYFGLEDMALRRLIDFSPLWRFSYIVIFTGKRSN